MRLSWLMLLGLFILLFAVVLLPPGACRLRQELWVRTRFERPAVLKPSARLACPDICEASGVVRSRRWPGVYWMHNDSGDRARIFAVYRDGSSARRGGRACPGVDLPGAANVDWEDIAADDAGNLMLCDCGNNFSSRDDLALYVVPEPRPDAATSPVEALRIPFFYPDQPALGRGPLDFDCEALFWAAGHMHLLTKHRSDTRTRMYRLDHGPGPHPRPLTALGEFDVGGMVTAADSSPDGRRLAVLTYTAVWLFEAAEPGGDYFGGKVRWLPILAGQCEAICFDGDTLLIANEQNQLFALAIERLKDWP